MIPNLQYFLIRKEKHDTVKNIKRRKGKYQNNFEMIYTVFIKGLDKRSQYSGKHCCNLLKLHHYLNI